MLNKRLQKGIAFSVLSSFLYLKHLGSLKLLVSKKEAVYRGFNLLNFKGKVLAVTAHPDDLEIFMGGTLKILSERNLEIHVIDVTDGERGTHLKNLAQVRINEQLNAGTILGINRIHFLHLPDLQLSTINNLEYNLRAAIEDIKPDIIFAFDPVYPFRAIIHPDHIAVGRAVSNIARTEMKQKIPIVYYASRRINTIVDISNSIESKIASVKAHRSQLRFGPGPYGLLVKKLAKYQAQKTSGQFVEVFRSI